MRQAARGVFPDVIFPSPPCKGFSGLLSGAAVGSEKYEALNRLTVRGLMLALEAFADHPPKFIILENVPRIAKRGRYLLTRLTGLLEAYGYAVSETVHDCGELGGLAQSRKRFLMVARHKAQVPPFLYEPERSPMKGVGEVLSALPVPGSGGGGPMHNLPRLQWRTWVRLALIEAGKDWRSLRDLAIENGQLRDIGIAPDTQWYASILGVRKWADPSGTVTANAKPTTGAFSIADPRTADRGSYTPYGVHTWSGTAGTVTAKAAPGSGVFSVADPRSTSGWSGAGKYRITRFDEAAPTVIAAAQTGQGAAALADPRLGGTRFNNVYRLMKWSGTSQAVTAGMGPSSGGQAVADPRPCPGSAGPMAELELPSAKQRCSPQIISLDGTWHRPFTTAELALLQSFPIEFVLGGSDSARREHIGNAVPPASAKRIADTMLLTLLLADTGRTFHLSSSPVWVDGPDPHLAVALSVRQS